MDTNNVVDINEFLRRKQLMDSLGSGGMSDYQQLPQTSSSVGTIASQGSGAYDTAPSGDTIVPPGKSNHPFLDKYRQSVEAIPSPDDEAYKPSGLRKGLGIAAGVLGGVLKRGSLEDRIKSGENVTNSIESGPYNEAAAPYINTAAKYKQLSDIEGSTNTVNDKAGLTEAQRREALSLSNLHDVEAAGKPPDYKTAVADDLEKERQRLSITQGKNREAKLTDGSIVMLHEEANGTLRKATPDGTSGEIINPSAIQDISDPDRSLKDKQHERMTGNLAQAMASKKIIAEGPGGPSNYSQSDVDAAKEIDARLAKGENATQAFNIILDKTNAERKAANKPELTASQITDLKHKVDPEQKFAPLFEPDPATGKLKVITPKPGSEVSPSIQTASGVNSENTETQTTKTMRETAPHVVQFMDKLDKEIDDVKDSLGPEAGRWSEFMTGKVGADNPKIARLRTDSMLAKTLIMRMHLGARGGQSMYEHFNNMLDTGMSSPDNLHAATGAIRDYANDIAKPPEHGGSAPSSSSNEPTLDEINAEVARRKREGK